MCHLRLRGGGGAHPAARTAGVPSSHPLSLPSPQCPPRPDISAQRRGKCGGRHPCRTLSPASGFPAPRPLISLSADNQGFLQASDPTLSSPLQLSPSTRSLQKETSQKGSEAKRKPEQTQVIQVRPGRRVQEEPVPGSGRQEPDAPPRGAGAAALWSAGLGEVLRHHCRDSPGILKMIVGQKS